MSTTNSTDEQAEQVNTVLKGLAEAKCDNCEGRGRFPNTQPMNMGEILLECPTCKGSGLDPRTELFRVACPYNDGEDHYKWECDDVRMCEREQGDSTEPNWWADYDGSDEECPLSRHLTPDEAEIKGLEMLRKFQFVVDPGLFETGWHIFKYGDASVAEQDFQPDLLLAILSAVASAVDVGVTA